LARPTRAPASVRALGLEPPTLAQVGRSFLRSVYLRLLLLHGVCGMGAAIPRAQLFPSSLCFVFLGSGLAKVLNSPGRVLLTLDNPRPRRHAQSQRPFPYWPTLLVPTESPADSSGAQRHHDQRMRCKGGLEKQLSDKQFHFVI
jgi:hypothetical protein